MLSGCREVVRRVSLRHQVVRRRDAGPCEASLHLLPRGAVTRYRLTGGSMPLGGAQWERKDDDREIARRVLNLFADRRMLWKDFSTEIEEHCVSSANRVREQIGVHLDNPEIGAELARRLQLLQRLFRDFVDEVGATGGDRHRRHWSSGTDPLSMALGRLRGLVGVQVGEMAAELNLDVSEELATIVPDQSGWFFERFDSGAT